MTQSQTQSNICCKKQTPILILLVITLFIIDFYCDDFLYIMNRTFMIMMIDTTITNISLSISSNKYISSVSIMINNTIINDFETNPYCKYLRPNVTFYIGFQHKTGHIIGQHLMRYLDKYCGHNSNHSSTKYKKRSRKNKYFYAKQINNEPTLIYKLLNTNKINKNDVFIYHFTRDPLNTILSGYNYWKNGKEGWVKKTNIKKLKHDTVFIKFNYNLNKSYNVYKKNGKVSISNKYPYKCYLDEYILNSNFPFDFDMKLLKYPPFNINDNKYNIKWMINNNYSISKWYTKLDKDSNYFNKSMGIFQEFKRYFNCEYNDKYSMYQLIKKYHGENNKYHIYWNDDIKYNFDQNMNRFLDSINFIETERNNKILEIYNVSNFNITNERNKFFKLISELKGNKKHSAGNFESRDEQSHLLLSLNNYTCLNLKKMTTMISAPWNHSNYC